jgi:uncharacterized membrane protein
VSGRPNSLVVTASLAIPSEVAWSYFVGGTVFAVGLVTIFFRGQWQKAQGFEKLILFGPIFYAAPVAAFGTEHLTITKSMESMVPSWIAWHEFWIYFVGVCFIAGALSLVTRIQARLSASLFALTFFLFVLLMDAPAWATHPHDRFAAALALRELSFGCGALALAISLTNQSRARLTHILATIVRYMFAVAVLFYSFEQLMHGDHVPGVPLRAVTPEWIFGHAIWTYLAAVVYAIAGILLLIGKNARAAATWMGLTVLFLVMVVYLPMAVVEHTSLTGLNYFADTLMYCGAVLLVAGAMPKSAWASENRNELAR